MLTDYYIHLREGFILPFQNTTKVPVLKTSDLLNVPVDLIFLPLITNAKLSTHAAPNQIAAAVGYIYYDDGVSNNGKAARFDINLILGLSMNIANITVNQTQFGYDFDNTLDEMVSSITILGASRVGLDKAI